MSKKTLVDAISVKSPCSEPWEKMKGTATMRFCSHCSKDVTNISEMTRKDAMRFVRSSDGKICIRIIRDQKTEKNIFVSRLHQISGRTPILATGLLSASLGITTSAYAQDDRSIEKLPIPTVSSRLDNETIVIDKDDVEEQNVKVGGTISGVLLNEDGAPATWVRVRLIDQETKEEFHAESDDEGKYIFDDVEPGMYTLRIDPNTGFKKRILVGISVRDDQIVRDLRLTSRVEKRISFAMGGAVAFVDYELKLNRAIANDDIETVRKLLSSGENVNAKDRNFGGISPLFTAVEFGNIEIVRMLIDAGADVDQTDAAGQTALMRIDSDATTELVELLISKGAKVNVTDEDGDTPLLLAIRNAKFDVVKVLIDAKADVSAANDEGKTALMEAAQQNEKDILKAILLAGVKVDGTDKNGESAYDKTSDEEIEIMLVSYGAIPPSDAAVELPKNGDTSQKRSEN